MAALGLARATGPDPALATAVLRLQRDLFVAAADLAANPRARDRLVPEISPATPQMTARLESEIDALTGVRPLRPAFVVPGANPTSAALDLARTIVRRAERRLVGYRTGARQSTDPHVLAYPSLLSDLLYVLARQAAGDHEEPVSHDDASGQGRPDT